MTSPTGLAVGQWLTVDITAKKSGNDRMCKSPIPTVEPNPLKPIEPEIIVQNLPNPPEKEHTTPEATNMERKNFLTITETPEEENPLADAEEHLIHVLRELQ